MSVFFCRNFSFFSPANGLRVLYFLSIIFLFWTTLPSALIFAKQSATPLPSLQAATGIWDMPTARVLPDWHLRIKYGKAEPYRYYGVALGLFDTLEIHGQFTEVSSLQGFSGPNNYGYYKDRSAGARLVLLKEKEWFPQVAIGAYDAIGTLLFPTRYFVASKKINDVDFTVGLGQGLLGGQTLASILAKTKRQGETFNTSFLFSSPFRQTRVFGGLEYSWSPKLTLSVEYSPIKYEGMFGGPEKAKIPVNLGIKYRPTKHIYLEAGYMRGNELALGLSADLPLSPQGILPWKKEKKYQADEQKRWRAYSSSEDKLAKLIGTELRDDGFAGVAVASGKESLWIELTNNKYLSDPKALGRIATIIDSLSPPHIKTFYINLLKQGQIRTSLQSSRKNLRAFMESLTDKKAFLTFADLNLYSAKHYKEFFNKNKKVSLIPSKYNWYSFELNPRIKTFLNNKNGFFKHKVILQPRLKLYPWHNGTLHNELEFPLYNEWDTLNFGPLEKEPTVTDLNEYEKHSSPRVSMLALEQYIELPYNIMGRAAAGYFETSYAGVGGELFRYFKNGRFGIGLESELARKRDPEDLFRLHPTNKHNYLTGFVNLYGLLWPQKGLEAGLKIGQFAGGDFGVRTELRRSWKYFTIGAWYTHTNTNNFTNPKNIGNQEKGVYIRVPLSIFANHDIRGHLLYVFSSFTRDPGQMINQPTSLYPLDMYDSVDYSKRHLEEMRKER